jgi:hypothetical protein
MMGSANFLNERRHLIGKEGFDKTLKFMLTLFKSSKASFEKSTLLRETREVLMDVFSNGAWEGSRRK